MARADEWCAAECDCPSGPWKRWAGLRNHRRGISRGTRSHPVHLWIHITLLGGRIRSRHGPPALINCSSRSCS